MIRQTYNQHGQFIFVEDTGQAEGNRNWLQRIQIALPSNAALTEPWNELEEAFGDHKTQPLPLTKEENEAWKESVKLLSVLQLISDKWAAGAHALSSSPNRVGVTHRLLGNFSISDALEVNPWLLVPLLVGVRHKTQILTPWIKWYNLLCKDH